VFSNNFDTNTVWDDLSLLLLLVEVGFKKVGETELS
jgi:hypothetical protein